MDTYFSHSMFERRPITKSKARAVKWFKQWVPQDVIATGGKCLVLKWVNEASLNAIKEKPNEPEIIEAQPEPTTEVLFLCSYEGCGKTLIDAGALKTHSHIHGERQYICHYENCGKKFLDSSKLKRHFLIHTGERHFVCPHEGCGKAFSLDFNLRSHMKTHSQENYHICPYPECGKRYAHEYKLNNHIASHHLKSVMDAPKYTPSAEKPTKLVKPCAKCPYACPYDGCEKAYIHEYKLNLHLRREHPGHFPENDNTVKKTEPNNENGANEGSNPNACSRKRVSNSKAAKQSKRKPNELKTQPPLAKVPRRKSSGVGGPGALGGGSSVAKKGWGSRGEEDSEETEVEREKNMEGSGWVYGENNEDDDEEDDDSDEGTE